MKFLYHVDILGDENEIKEFFPRIPKCRIEGEDNTIKRICVSKNIEGCLGATSWGQKINRNIKEFQVLRVYVFDIKDIKKDNLILDKDLYERGLVLDAKIYNECWIVNQSIKPCKVFYISINSYDIEYKNLIESNYKGVIKGYCAKYTKLKYTIIPKNEVQFGLKCTVKVDLNKINFNNIKDTSKAEYMTKKVMDILDKDGYLNGKAEITFNSISKKNILSIKLNLSYGLWMSKFIDYEKCIN